jgi:hypothetical protein
MNLNDNTNYYFQRKGLLMKYIKSHSVVTFFCVFICLNIHCCGSFAKSTNITNSDTLRIGFLDPIPDNIPPSDYSDFQSKKLLFKKSLINAFLNKKNKGYTLTLEKNKYNFIILDKDLIPELSKAINYDQTGSFHIDPNKISQIIMQGFNAFIVVYIYHNGDNLKIITNLILVHGPDTTVGNTITVNKNDFLNNQDKLSSDIANGFFKTDHDGHNKHIDALYFTAAATSVLLSIIYEDKSNTQYKQIPIVLSEEKVQSWGKYKMYASRSSGCTITAVNCFLCGMPYLCNINNARKWTLVSPYIVGAATFLTCGIIYRDKRNDASNKLNSEYFPLSNNRLKINGNYENYKELEKYMYFNALIDFSAALFPMLFYSNTISSNNRSSNEHFLSYKNIAIYNDFHEGINPQFGLKYQFHFSRLCL